MSQAKVDAYKSAKNNRKNWKNERIKSRIIGWVASALCVAVIVLVCVLINKKNYDSINTGFAEYDEVALASVIGYDGISLEAKGIEIE